MINLLYLEASGTVFGPLTHEQLVEMYFAARLPITTAVSKQANGPFTELYKSTLLIEFAFLLPQWYWRTPLHSVGPVSGIQLYSHLLNGTSQNEGEVFHAFFTRGVWVATRDCVAFCRGNVNKGIHQQLGSSGVNDLEQYQNSGNDLDEQPAHKAAADRTKILLDRAHTSVQKDRKRQSAVGIRKISLLTICIGLMVVLFFVGKNVVEERFGGTDPKSSGSSLASDSIFKSKFKSKLSKEQRDQYLKLVKSNNPVGESASLNKTCQILYLTKKYIQHRPPLESQREMPDFPSLSIADAMKQMKGDMLTIAEKLIGKDTITYNKLRTKSLDLSVKTGDGRATDREHISLLLEITEAVIVKYCGVKITALRVDKNHDKNLENLDEQQAKIAIRLGTNHVSDLPERKLRYFNSLLKAAGIIDEETKLTSIRPKVVYQSREMAIKFFEHFLP